MGYQFIGKGETGEEDDQVLLLGVPTFPIFSI